MLQRFFKKYGKAIVSVLVACGIASWQGMSGDHHIDGREGVVVLLAFLNAGMVFIIPLVPEYPWAKTAVGVGIAGATALSAVMLGGLSYDELTVVGMAIVQALGIKFAPAVSNNGVEAPTGFSDAPEEVGFKDL